jgi:hypothetical protein
MHAERYSLFHFASIPTPSESHFLFSRQNPKPLCSAKPSLFERIELPELTTRVPLNTVLFHADMRRLFSRFSELRSRSKNVHSRYTPRLVLHPINDNFWLPIAVSRLWCNSNIQKAKNLNATAHVLARSRASDCGHPELADIPYRQRHYNLETSPTSEFHV